MKSPAVDDAHERATRATPRLVATVDALMLHPHMGISCTPKAPNVPRSNARHRPLSVMRVRCLFCNIHMVARGPARRQAQRKIGDT